MSLPPLSPELVVLLSCLPKAPYSIRLKEHIELYGQQCRGEQAQAVEQEPVAWTLTETLDKRVTTTSGYLWFSNPVNCCWTPLYTHPAPPVGKHVPEADFGNIKPAPPTDWSAA